jgi:hypothetical protein
MSFFTFPEGFLFFLDNDQPFPPGAVDSSDSLGIIFNRGESYSTGRKNLVGSKRNFNYLLTLPLAKGGIIPLFGIEGRGEIFQFMSIQ